MDMLKSQQHWPKKKPEHLPQTDCKSNAPTFNTNTLATMKEKLNKHFDKSHIFNSMSTKW